ncbi:hypothetical protein EYF80_039027 [Liparis tanakae]|uniref:Uncharacterized protein n=1 Tax=Liparis tanakae TaxID=230148 RepID=A0A4Z2GDL5_9TELE|nr:hypothetical protein EYF80_039027 [Liparis tanakae]
MVTKGWLSVFMGVIRLSASSVSIFFSRSMNSRRSAFSAKMSVPSRVPYFESPEGVARVGASVEKAAGLGSGTQQVLRGKTLGLGNVRGANRFGHVAGGAKIDDFHPVGVDQAEALQLHQRRGHLLQDRPDALEQQRAELAVLQEVVEVLLQHLEHEAPFRHLAEGAASQELEHLVAVGHGAQDLVLDQLVVSLAVGVAALRAVAVPPPPPPVRLETTGAESSSSIWTLSLLSTSSLFRFKLYCLWWRSHGWEEDSASLTRRLEEKDEEEGGPRTLPVLSAARTTVCSLQPAGGGGAWLLLYTGLKLEPEVEGAAPWVELCR